MNDVIWGRQACSSDLCHRKACPCPDACRVLERGTEPDLPLTGGDVALAVGIVLACVIFVALGPATVDLVRALLS